MFIKKMIYVNWGNIPNMEFDFGPVTLFSGGNGSGKTTAADGIQALMTATTAHLFNFNPGQDETTQRGRGGKQVRTLASYILGCDDGSYARLRPTDGYLAGIFYPTQGEHGSAFTAVMGVRASLDTAGSQRQAKEDDVLFLIIPNQELTLDHFVRKNTSGKYVVMLDHITNLLRKEFGKSAIESYDNKKKAYLRRLYSALRGQKSAVSGYESSHAAKTFSNFMAYKPVKSIHTFVAKEILESKDLSDDIKQVSDLMKTIHSMEQETRQVKSAIEHLQNAHDCAMRYITHWTAYTLGLHTESTRLLSVSQNELLSLKTKHTHKSHEKNEITNRITINTTKREQLFNQLIELNAQRKGIPALKNKDDLEQQIASYQSELVQNAKPLLEQLSALEANVQHSKMIRTLLKSNAIGEKIPELDHAYFRKRLTAVIERGNHTGVDAHKLFNTDWVGITDLEDKLDQLIELETVHCALFMALHEDKSLDTEALTIRDKLVTAKSECQASQSKYTKLIVEKQAQIKRLEAKSVSYPAAVQAAIKAINNQCPQARPCVLCDYIEIIDPDWQMAIEGYMGGNRFSIIVESDFEAEAIQIVRAIKGKRNGAKIIQGGRAQREAERLSLPEQSIFEVMRFEHRIVEYYIKAAYGNVLRVPNAEALKSIPRGITADGLGASSYSMYRCDIDDGDLVFGQGARERALTAKQRELAALNAHNESIEQQYRFITELSEVIASIKTINCSKWIKSMLKLYHDLQNSEQQLKNLDLSGFKEIETLLETTDREHKAVCKSISALEIQKGEIISQLKNSEDNIQKKTYEQEKLQERNIFCEKQVLAISALYSDYDVHEALERSERSAKEAKHDFCFDDQNNDYYNRMENDERALYQVIALHNQQSSSYAHIHYFTGTGKRNDRDFFKAIVAIKHDIDLVYNSLKNNILIDKYEQLRSLKESFNTAFVTHLCYSIYQSINDGKRTLDDLNKELEHHRFGTDREYYYFSMRWIPEFHEYYKFFKEIINSPNLGDGNTLFDAELSDKSYPIRDKLLGMLLDKDEQLALRDLKRISDYRNYREYEIFKQPEGKDPIPLSQYGTGSGGQLETPAYIIRAAAITSAFKFNEGNTHCRMVLVDEAFSKMDEARSREVINYLTETQGLQIIFIMPTSKSGPFLDLISHQVVFSKCPSSEKIGELNSVVHVNRAVCKPEKIKALWENHKKTIRHQASLDFMKPILEEGV